MERHHFSDQPLAPLFVIGCVMVFAIVVGIVSTITAPTSDVLGASDGPHGMVQPVSIDQLTNTYSNTPMPTPVADTSAF